MAGDSATKTDASAETDLAHPALDLSCTYPVDGNSDTAQSLLERFGADAIRATLDGPEGIEWPGVLLWGDDPSRRIEVFLDESPDEKVANVVIRSPQSQWRIAGIGMESSAAALAAANGRAFTFWGYEWDYGGYVSDFGGGTFQTLPGNCTVQVRLEPSVEGPIPGGMSGEVQLRSGEARVAAIAPVVREFGLAWR